MHPRKTFSANKREDREERSAGIAGRLHFSIMMHTRIAADNPAQRPTVILGLSVAVECDAGSFRPRHEQHGLALFGDLRWTGWASALNAGYADRLIVIGGVERLNIKACVPGVGSPCTSDRDIICVPRGEACCHALSAKHGVADSKLSWKLSEGNTGGNATAIKEIVQDLSPSCNLVISSNHYHLPRALMNLHAAGVAGIAAVPAEAYWVAEQSRAGRKISCTRMALTDAFGGGPLAARFAAEIQGAADKINNQYAPLSR